MNISKLDYAKRKALQLFDAWLDVTGVVERNSGYYDELTGLIEEAVEIGAMVALGQDFEIVDGCLHVGLDCIESGMPEDNKMRFCPYCGGRLITTTRDGTEVASLSRKWNEFAKPCKCKFNQKMVGDGCDICNPDKYRND